MTAVWKEFPEINRKVAFSYGFESPQFSLGCHCGSISGITANFGGGPYGANNGHNVELLDATKEPPIKYGRHTYGSGTQAPQAEIDKILKYLKDTKFTFAQMLPDEYSQIVTKCEKSPLWVMSDVINYDAPFRKPTSLANGYTAVGNTGDFAKYLIDNKIGFVMESPIIQNPGHRFATNYSLLQGWFWIPPPHLARAIDVANVHGTDLFPSEEEWIKTVGFDLNILKTKPEEVLKNTLNAGVFPKTGLFKPRRGRDGRFISGPNLKEA